MLILLPVLIEIKNAPDYDTLPNLSWYRSLRSVHVKGATLAYRDDAPPSRKQQNPTHCSAGLALMSCMRVIQKIRRK